MLDAVAGLVPVTCSPASPLPTTSSVRLQRPREPRQRFRQRQWTRRRPRTDHLHPPSGSTFPIGDTEVTCTASDASGNRAIVTFTIHVQGAAEQLDDLGSTVIGVGRGTSLADKVEAAAAALERTTRLRPRRSLERSSTKFRRRQERRSIP
jgi:HYR domain